MSARRSAPRARCCAAQLARWASSVERQCLASACIAALAASGGPAHRLLPGIAQRVSRFSQRAAQLHGSQHRRRSSHNATTTWGPMPLRDARRASQTWPRWRVNTLLLGRPASSAGVESASSPRRVSSMATIRSAKRIKHSRLLCLPLQIQSEWAGLHCLKQGTSAWTSAHAVVGLWSVARWLGRRGLRLAPASHSDNWLVS